MLRRRLGRTNFEVSIVGFGGIPIARRTRSKAIRIVQRAIELGVNFIDTARSYGDSEDKIGEAIKGYRDKLFIATKSHYRTKKEVVDSIRESMRRLQLDKLDLIQMHSVDDNDLLEECLGKGGVYEAMHEARQAGLVDFIGISGHKNEVLVKAVKTGMFDTVLASYNLTNDDAAKELFPLAKELDIGVIVMKPLGGGALAIPPEAERFQVADRAIASAEAALRFVLSNPHISTAIPGMGTLREVEDDVLLGYTPQVMSLADAEQLQRRARKVGFTFCQGCGYCLPQCPEGIDIPEVFKLQVLYQQYGMINYAHDAYRESYEMKVAQCTECRACTERCPAELDIPELLKKARLILGSHS